MKPRLMTFQRLNTNDRGSYGSHFKGGKAEHKQEAAGHPRRGLAVCLPPEPSKGTTINPRWWDGKREVASTAGGEFTIDPFWGLVSQRGQWKSMNRN